MVGIFQSIRKREQAVRGRSTVQAIASAATLLLLGCGARAEYVASHLDVARYSWDSIHVDVAFAERMVIGGSSPTAADTVVITLLDAAYDTLYSGSPGLIGISDARLGHRERVTVEACGVVKRRQICAQGYVESSPKRVSLEEKISYPRAGNPEEGAYELSFHLERRGFDNNEWEPIEGRDIPGHFLVWVDDPEAKDRGTVRIPFTRPAGRFDLKRYENYKNFKYYLDSELLDHPSAKVTFEVHGGLSGAPVLLASTTREVRRKDQKDRENDVRYFAEQATELIIGRLGADVEHRSVIAYVEEWEFDTRRRSYSIEMEIEWEGDRRDRGRHQLDGMLRVREDGRSAEFEARSGNRRAARVWRERIRDQAVNLGELDVFQGDAITPM